MSCSASGIRPSPTSASSRSPARSGGSPRPSRRGPSAPARRPARLLPLAALEALGRQPVPLDLPFVGSLESRPRLRIRPVAGRLVFGLACISLVAVWRSTALGDDATGPHHQDEADQHRDTRAVGQLASHGSLLRLTART